MKNKFIDYYEIPRLSEELTIEISKYSLDNIEKSIQNKFNELQILIDKDKINNIKDLVENKKGLNSIYNELNSVIYINNNYFSYYNDESKKQMLSPLPEKSDLTTFNLSENVLTILKEYYKNKENVDDYDTFYLNTASLINDQFLKYGIQINPFQNDKLIKNFNNFKNNEISTTMVSHGNVDAIVREQYEKDLKLMNDMKKDPNCKFEA